MASIQSTNAPAFNVSQSTVDPPQPQYDPRLLTPGMMEQAQFAPAAQQPTATAASLAAYLSQLQRGRSPGARHVSVKSHWTQSFDIGPSMANSSTPSSGSSSGSGLNYSAHHSAQTYSAHLEINTYNDADLDTHIQELRRPISLHRTRSRYHPAAVVAQSQESDAAITHIPLTQQPPSDPTQSPAADNSKDTRYDHRGDAHIGE